MTALPSAGPKGPVHIVVTREVFVSHDIAATLHEALPDATILRASSVSDALEMLDDLTRVELAFLESAGDPSALACLGAAVVARGGRVVLMGFWSNGDSPLQPFATLPFPLGYDDLKRFLATVEG